MTQDGDRNRETPPNRPVVVTGADSNAVLPLLAMLRSMRRNSPDVELIVLAIGLDDGDLGLLEDQLPSDGSWRIMEIDPKLFEAASINSCHLSRAAYAPLALDMVLPNYDRVIWLDADTIILGDLKPLWALDLDGALLAATPDDFISQAELAATRTSMGLYFNSGVMVLDLELWRMSGFGALARARMLAGKLICEDQSVLNELARGRVKMVDRLWNFHAGRFHEYDVGLRPEYPSIVHFCGQLKPWTASVPFQGLFLDYLPSERRQLVRASMPQLSVWRRIELARRRLFGLLTGRQKHWRGMREQLEVAKALGVLRSYPNQDVRGPSETMTNPNARPQLSWLDVFVRRPVSRPPARAR